MPDFFRCGVACGESPCQKTWGEAQESPCDSVMSFAPYTWGGGYSRACGEEVLGGEVLDRTGVGIIPGREKIMKIRGHWMFQRKHAGLRQAALAFAVLVVLWVLASIKF